MAVDRKNIPHPSSDWSEEKQKAWKRAGEYWDRTGQPMLKPEVWSQGYDLRAQHVETAEEAANGIYPGVQVPRGPCDFPEYAPGAVRKKPDINSSPTASDVQQMLYEELAALHKELNQLEERLRPVLMVVHTTVPAGEVPEEQIPDGAVPMVQSLLSLYAVLNQAVDRVMEYNNRLRI
jgi:hypothetical protein